MSQRRTVFGFTLIEMLVVIAIIALLAAMIVEVAIRAAEAKKIKRVQAELQKLDIAIASYQSQLGSFPPDNGLNVKDALIDGRKSAATNPLFYELTGPTYDKANNQYISFDNSKVSSNEYYTAFQREGVLNSIEPRKFYNPPPKQADYRNNFVSGAPNVNVLMVPVDLQGNVNNSWRYDSSSTNRHNTGSFDVWAVYSVGNKIVTNGNW